MKTDAILQADLLDIIFDNRNKDYGAYTLRKYYNSRLFKAMGITFLCAALICTFSFLKKDKTPFILSGPIVEILKAPPIPDKKVDNPPQKKKVQTPQTSQPKPAAQEYVNGLKITNNPLTSSIKDLDDKTDIGTENVKGTPSDTFQGPQKPDGKEVVFLKPDSLQKMKDHITPLNTAEIMPVYPGGMQALRKFLEQNLTTPQDLNEGQTVSVKIKFVVGFDGKLKGFQTMEDGGAAFNNEVIRVLKKMPDWIPGKTKGENVSVFYTIPVMFSTSE